MALPTSRNTTYAAGSQVKSADLNDVQDKIVDIHVDGVHGDRYKSVGGWIPYNWSTATAGRNLTTGAFDGNAGSGSLSLDLGLAEGDRIKSAACYTYGDGVDDHNYSLWIVSQNPGTAPVQLGATVTATNAPASWNVRSIASTHTLQAGESIVALMEGVGSGSFVGPVRVNWDRPG